MIFHALTDGVVAVDMGSLIDGVVEGLIPDVAPKGDAVTSVDIYGLDVLVVYNNVVPESSSVRALKEDVSRSSQSVLAQAITGDEVISTTNREKHIGSKALDQGVFFGAIAWDVVVSNGSFVVLAQIEREDVENPLSILINVPNFEGSSSSGKGPKMISSRERE
ncbi:hypothetical protein KY290_007942 [Solanum tuberosum]|uniref:Uncharacterized protein n=1 Tax=Solanum tuberosum TaxID=4113 RepID=A0ABQ7W6Z7_SOLTU|nr:hypothetical protein KY290_007942 [Solanum tuberosum]